MPSEEFGPSLKQLIRERKLTISEFARRAKCSRNQADSVIRGVRRPPLDHLDAWCDVLGLKGEARDTLILLGNLGHTPALVRERLARLEGEIERLQKSKARHPRKRG